jgi:hypothetical protein
MSLRKPTAALAALTAAAALAVPAASASAATTAPTGRALTLVGPGSLYCQVLYRELTFAFATGNIPAENVLGNVFVYSRCGGAAI